MGSAIKKIAPIAVIAVGAFAGYAVFGGALGAIRGASLGFRLAGALGGGESGGQSAGSVGQTSIPDTGQLATAIGEDAWVPKQYGNRRAGMVLVASDVMNSSHQIIETGAAGAFATSVYVLGEGPWDEINNLNIADVKIFETGQTIEFGITYSFGNSIFSTDKDFSNLEVTFVQGLLGQALPNVLSRVTNADGSRWFGDTDIGNGICYMVLRIKRTTEATIRNTAPTNFTIEAKGKKVPDVRLENSTVKDNNGNYTNAVYTRNPALIALDQLRTSEFGLGLTDAEIDFDSFVDFANFCDAPGTYSDGTTIEPFRLDGQFGQGDTIRQILEEISLCTGALFADENGIVTVKIDKFELSTTSVAINEDNIVNSITRIEPKTSETPNVINVKYIDEDGFEVIDVVEFSNTIQNIEGRKEADLQLRMVAKQNHAVELGKRYLYQTRQPTFQFKMNMAGYDLDTYGVCSIADPFQSRVSGEIVPGSGVNIVSTNNKIRIFNITKDRIINSEGNAPVSVLAKLYSDDIYIVNPASMVIAPTVKTSDAPGLLNIPAPTGAILTRLTNTTAQLNWNNITQYQTTIEFRKSTTQIFSDAKVVENSPTTINFLDPGTYVVRLRYIIPQSNVGPGAPTVLPAFSSTLVVAGGETAIENGVEKFTAFTPSQPVRVLNDFTHIRYADQVDGTGIRTSNLPAKEIETITHSGPTTEPNAFILSGTPTPATSTVTFPSDFDAGASVNETQVFDYTGTRSNLVSNAANEQLLISSTPDFVLSDPFGNRKQFELSGTQPMEDAGPILSQSTRGDYNAVALKTILFDDTNYWQGIDGKLRKFTSQANFDNNIFTEFDPRTDAIANHIGGTNYATQGKFLIEDAGLYELTQSGFPDNKIISFLVGENATTSVSKFFGTFDVTTEKWTTPVEYTTNDIFSSVYLATDGTDTVVINNYTSTDRGETFARNNLQNWDTVQTTGTNPRISCAGIVYFNSLFIGHRETNEANNAGDPNAQRTFRNKHLVRTSADGVSWVDRLETAEDNDFNFIEAGDRLFLLENQGNTNSGRLFSTTNGTSWSALSLDIVPFSSGQQDREIPSIYFYNNEYYIIYRTSGDARTPLVIYKSTAGVAFTTVPEANDPTGIISKISYQMQLGDTVDSYYFGINNDPINDLGPLQLLDEVDNSGPEITNINFDTEGLGSFTSIGPFDLPFTNSTDLLTDIQTKALNANPTFTSPTIGNVEVTTTPGLIVNDVLNTTDYIATSQQSSVAYDGTNYWLPSSNTTPTANIYSTTNLAEPSPTYNTIRSGVANSTNNFYNQTGIYADNTFIASMALVDGISVFQPNSNILTESNQFALNISKDSGQSFTNVKLGITNASSGQYKESQSGIITATSIEPKAIQKLSNTQQNILVNNPNNSEARFSLSRGLNSSLDFEYAGNEGTTSSVTVPGHTFSDGNFYAEGINKNSGNDNLSFGYNGRGFDFIDDDGSGADAEFISNLVVGQSLTMIDADGNSFTGTVALVTNYPHFSLAVDFDITNVNQYGQWSSGAQTVSLGTDLTFKNLKSNDKDAVVYLGTDNVTSKDYLLSSTNTTTNKNLTISSIFGANTNEKNIKYSTDISSVLTAGDYISRNKQGELINTGLTVTGVSDNTLTFDRNGSTTRFYTDQVRIANSADGANGLTLIVSAGLVDTTSFAAQGDISFIDAGFNIGDTIFYDSVVRIAELINGNEPVTPVGTLTISLTGTNPPLNNNQTLITSTSDESADLFTDGESITIEATNLQEKSSLTGTITNNNTSPSTWTLSESNTTPAFLAASHTFGPTKINRARIQSSFSGWSTSDTTYVRQYTGYHWNRVSTNDVVQDSTLGTLDYIKDEFLYSTRGEISVLGPVTPVEMGIAKVQNTGNVSFGQGSGSGSIAAPAIIVNDNAGGNDLPYGAGTTFTLVKGSNEVAFTVVETFEGDTAITPTDGTTDLTSIFTSGDVVNILSAGTSVSYKDDLVNAVTLVTRNLFYTSPDAVNWTVKEAGTNFDTIFNNTTVRRPTFINSEYFIKGAKSSNLINWTPEDIHLVQNSSSINSLDLITYNGSVNGYIYANSGNTLFISGPTANLPTLTINYNSATNFNSSVEVESKGVPGILLENQINGAEAGGAIASIYTISDPQGNQIVQFNGSVGSSSNSDLTTVLNAIETAVDNNTETPDFTLTQDNINKKLTLTAATPNTNGDAWAISVNHSTGNGNIIITGPTITAATNNKSFNFTVNTGDSFQLRQYVNVPQTNFTSGANATTAAAQLGSAVQNAGGDNANIGFTTSGDVTLTFNYNVADSITPNFNFFEANGTTSDTTVTHSPTAGNIGTISLLDGTNLDAATFRAAKTQLILQEPDNETDVIKRGYFNTYDNGDKDNLVTLLGNTNSFMGAQDQSANSNILRQVHDAIENSVLTENNWNANSSANVLTVDSVNNKKFNELWVWSINNGTGDGTIEIIEPFEQTQEGADVPPFYGLRSTELQGNVSEIANEYSWFQLVNNQNAGLSLVPSYQIITPFQPTFDWDGTNPPDNLTIPTGFVSLNTNVINSRTTTSTNINNIPVIAPDGTPPENSTTRFVNGRFYVAVDVSRPEDFYQYITRTNSDTFNPNQFLGAKIKATTDGGSPEFGATVFNTVPFRSATSGAQDSMSIVSRKQSFVGNPISNTVTEDSNPVTTVNLRAQDFLKVSTGDTLTAGASEFVITKSTNTDSSGGNSTSINLGSSTTIDSSTNLTLTRSQNINTLSGTADSLPETGTVTIGGINDTEFSYIKSNIGATNTYTWTGADGNQRGSGTNGLITLTYTDSDGVSQTENIVLNGALDDNIADMSAGEVANAIAQSSNVISAAGDANPNQWQSGSIAVQFSSIITNPSLTLTTVIRAGQALTNETTLSQTEYITIPTVQSVTNGMAIITTNETPSLTLQSTPNNNDFGNDPSLAKATFPNSGTTINPSFLPNAVYRWTESTTIAGDGSWVKIS